MPVMAAPLLVELRFGGDICAATIVSSLPVALTVVSPVDGPEGVCSSKGCCANMFAEEPLLSG